MKDFNELCQDIENLKKDSYLAILKDYSDKVMPELRKLSADDFDCKQNFETFILACLYADGRLHEEEFSILSPLLYSFFGDIKDYKTAKRFFKESKDEGKEIKLLVEEFVNCIGGLNQQLKEDIVSVCLLICAVDGKVSAKEKKFIKQLI